VLDAEAMSHVDSSGLKALADLSEGLAREQITMRVARMKTPVQELLEEAGIVDRIGLDHFHPPSAPR
jgi:SulP family sulfate permease